MGIEVGSNRGIQAEMNVVPLIDILLVLLVIFIDHPVAPEGLGYADSASANGNPADA